MNTVRRSESIRNVDRRDAARDHEILLRGLLAGLNSCEFESEVFELLHTELATPLSSERMALDRRRKARSPRESLKIGQSKVAFRSMRLSRVFAGCC